MPFIQGSCTDTSNCHSTFLGVDQPAFAKNINIYPNPAQQQLNITGNLLMSVNKVVLSDIAGKVLQTEVIARKAGVLTLDIHKLHAGIYFVKLTAGSEQAVFRFVKQ